MRKHTHTLMPIYTMSADKFTQIRTHTLYNFSWQLQWH